MWRRRPPTPHPRLVDAAGVLAGVGLGASSALPVASTSWSALRAPGGLTMLFGDVTAMAGTYLLLMMVLLAGRIPVLERVLGQARLLRWHRRLSSAPLLLLGAHAVLSTLGEAEVAHAGLWSETGTLITSMAWILAAVVSYVMLAGIAGVSIRAARRRFGYDTWWAIHLYMYLALAFSVPHQIVDGNAFIGHPLAKAAWAALWLATAGVVVVYRIGFPVARSAYYGLRLESVQFERPDVYSLVVRGRHLERLGVAGGQYFGWRFLVRGMWWHAHPFSISALPDPPFLRVTVKIFGNATTQIARLRPGTRIGIEGPYGAFTDAARTRTKVALIGAGVGIAPLRSLLEDLPAGVDLVVIHRASSEGHLIHRQEIAGLVAAKRGRLVELVGPRGRHRLDHPRQLATLIPDLISRDLYVCGPDTFSAGVIRSARDLGVPASAIHQESFGI